MNKRNVVGVEIPADITDPRLSVEDIKGHQAALLARFNELKSEGTSALSKRAELTVALEELRQEVQGRVDLVAQDIAAAATLAVVEPAVAEQVLIVPPANTTGHSEDVTVGAPVELDMAAEADKEALVAAARLALQSGGGTLDGTGAELTPNDDGSKGPKTASWKPYLGAGTRIADTAPLDTAEWGERLEASMTAVKNAAMGAPKSNPGDGGKVYANRIASLVDDGSVAVTEALGEHQSAQGNTDLIVAALAATRARHESRPGGKAAAFCGPPDIVREIPFSSSADSPIRDALTFVPSAHMTWLFNGPVTTLSMESSVTSWNDANQAAVDPNTPSTWKSCVNYDCVNAIPVGCQDWTVACATWPLAMQMSNPERVMDIQRRIEVVKARRIEQKLRAAIKALSTTTGPWPTIYSSLPDFVYAVNTTMAYSGYAERLDNAPYVAIMDADLLWNLWCDLSRTPHAEGRDYEEPIQWILKRTPLTGVVLARDRTAIGYGNSRVDSVGTTNANPVVTDVSIQAIDLGKSVTGTGIPAGSYVGTVIPGTSFRLSSTQGTQTDANATATGTVNATVSSSIGNPFSDNLYVPGATVAPFQITTKYETQLLPIDEVFAWGTGEIRMGAMQDFNLIRQNRVATFVEEAVCLTKFGTHPWFNLQTVLCPTGTRTGWTNPVACV